MLISTPGVDLSEPVRIRGRIPRWQKAGLESLKVLEGRNLEEYLQDAIAMYLEERGVNVGPA